MNDFFSNLPLYAFAIGVGSVCLSFVCLVFSGAVLGNTVTDQHLKQLWVGAGFYIAPLFVIAVVSMTLDWIKALPEVLK